MINFETIPELLLERAREAPDANAFVYLADGEDREEAITRSELRERALAVAGELLKATAPGERALLLYPSGLDFIAAFLGCLYSGVIAVPTFPPRFPPASAAGGKKRGSRDHNLERLRGIIKDARPGVLLCPRSLLDGLNSNEEEFAGMKIIVTDEIEPRAPGSESPSKITGDTIAFLQYTSGSTGTPRGVRISHRNLMANEAMIQRAFGFPKADEMLVVGWLPLNHDMGLIGQILQPLYNGGRCVFMSPMHFIQQPVRWLRAISRFHANTSPAPNFAYEQCLERVGDDQLGSLDLSSWQRALSGAEPVRARILESFAERFAPAGFRREAFYPCYGLAEATLVVSGRKLSSVPVILSSGEQGASQGGEPLTGCGGVDPDLEILLVDERGAKIQNDNQVGEILLRGPSIAPGYWSDLENGRRQDHDDVFAAHLENGEGPYLRTGDLAFLRAGELFITGRLKDLLIIDGRNLYPRDIEDLALENEPALQAAAAFSVERDGEEQMVLAAEVRRSHRLRNPEEMDTALRAELSESFDVSVAELVFLKPGSLPRTSSGKLRRNYTRELYLAGRLPNPVNQPG